MKTYNYLLSALLALAFFGVSANAQQPARRNGSNGVTARQESKVERQQNKVDKVQMPTNLSNQNATDLKVRDARIKETPQGSYGTTNRTPRVNGGSSSGSSGSGYGNGGSAYGNRPPQGGNNNGSYGGSGYGNRPPQGGNNGSSNGGSAYGNRPPQGGNNGSGYGNRPPQGGNSGSGYGNRPPQGGNNGSSNGGSAYGNRPPQGGNNGYGNRPPQGGNNGSGYGNRPPQGGSSGSGYGNRPPQGGSSGSGYGNRPPQGIPEVARRPALPPVIVYSRPEIYERTNANSIVVNTLFSSKAEAYDYIAALLDARYYTLTAYGNNYNRIISDVAFIPTPFDWTNPMTHNQFKMQFDISRVFGTVRVTITAYWRESVLSSGFTRLRFQPSDRYSTYYAWRVLEDFASEIPHTAIRYN